MAAEAAFREANELVVDDEYEAAVEKYTEAISIDAEKAAYFLKRAAAFAKLGKHESALQDTKRAIELDASDPRAYFRKGCV